MMTFKLIKKYSTLLLCTAAAALAGCSSDPEMFVDSTNRNVIGIAVDNTQSFQTRALSEEDAHADYPATIGVFGYRWGEDASAELLFDNQKMEYQTGLTSAFQNQYIDENTPDNTVYGWSDGAGNTNIKEWAHSNRYEFFAYAPHMTTGQPTYTQSTDAESHNGIITWDIPIINTEDWLVAPYFMSRITSSPIKNEEKSVVRFVNPGNPDSPEKSLQHLYARLRIQLGMSAEYARLRQIHITEIKILPETFYTDGQSTYTFTAAGPDDENYVQVEYFSYVSKYNTSATPITGGSATEYVFPRYDKDGRESDIVTLTHYENNNLSTPIEREGLLLTKGYTDRNATDGFVKDYGQLYLLPVLFKANTFRMEITYDIYENYNGSNPDALHNYESYTNRWIETRTITNTINLTPSQPAHGGYAYNLRILIDPAFIYTLTDGDQDWNLK